MKMVLPMTLITKQKSENPNKYEIKHIYRYEGDTDPGNEAVVYGTESSGKKGAFVTGF
jgi:hypothetical protein